MGNIANPDMLRQLGYGGAVAVVVLWVVFDFLTKVGVVTPAAVPTDPRAMDTRSQAAFERMAAQTAELHAWHNQKDENGLFIWIIPRSMTRAIDDQTAVLNELLMLQKLERNDREREQRRRGTTLP